MGAVARPLPATVASKFATLYYRVAAELPARVSEFYGKLSELDHGPGLRAVGISQIEALTDRLPLAHTSATIHSVIGQSSHDDMVLVVVRGSYSSPPIPFIQTFVLAKQSDSHSEHFFCRNDVFLSLSTTDLPADTPPVDVPAPIDPPAEPVTPSRPSVPVVTPSVVPASNPAPSVEPEPADVPAALDVQPVPTPIPSSIAAAPSAKAQPVAADAAPRPDTAVNGVHDETRELSDENPVEDDSVSTPTHDPTVTETVKPVKITTATTNASITASTSTSSQQSAQSKPSPTDAEKQPDREEADDAKPGVRVNGTPRSTPVKKTWASVVSAKDDSSSAAPIATRDGSVGGNATALFSPSTSRSPSRGDDAKENVAMPLPNVPDGKPVRVTGSTGENTNVTAPAHGAPPNVRHMHGHYGGHGHGPRPQRTFGPSAVVQLASINMYSGGATNTRALENNLKEEFSRYGHKLRHVEVKLSKGIAFIEYESMDGVRAAVEAWSRGPRPEGVFAGQHLHVSEKRNLHHGGRRPGSMRGGRGGNGGGAGGGARGARRNRMPTTQIG